MKLLNTIIMRIILLCAGLKQDSVISVKGEFRIKIGQLINLKNVKNSSKKMRFKDKKKLNWSKKRKYLEKSRKSKLKWKDWNKQKHNVRGKRNRQGLLKKELNKKG